MYKISFSFNSPIITKLMNMPQIRSLLEQEAGGRVEQIIITTPAADVQELKNKNIDVQPIGAEPFGHVWITEDKNTHEKKPLDKIIRIDKTPTDEFQALVTILHEMMHLKNPTWSESQVEAEAERLAATVKQHIGAQNIQAELNDLYIALKKFSFSHEAKQVKTIASSKK